MQQAVAGDHSQDPPRLSRKWTAELMPSQAGRTALVTGANSGLGLESTVALARAGAQVVMACRDPRKAAAALEQVRRRVPQAQVGLMSLDLASLASVRQFAGEFRARHQRLDLLINNAGIMGVPLRRTVDGFESQIGTNHLGHFALTGLLIEPLLATPGARIVTVGSMGHWNARGLDLDDLNFERCAYAPFAAYCKSKLANLLFVLELSRRLAARGSGVIAAAAHPGGADTNIKPQPNAIVKAIALRFFVNTAAQGALPTLYAATAPQVRGNDYFGPDGFLGMRGYPGPARRHRAARDAALARRLWELSESLTATRYLG
jgi:NAD(P)-dependent dehydrogenase (short-subunit alcohol dehydrogenase family)